MKAEIFYRELKDGGFGPFIGVPCSILKPLLNVIDESEKLIATSEGEAAGICSGMSLAGAKPVVFMQNSGLCNVLNPLISLNLVYRLPLFMLITMRGEPAIKDAPQHEVMGQKTCDILDMLGVEYCYLSDSVEELKRDLGYLKGKMEKEQKSAAFILRKGALTADGSSNDDVLSCGELTRREAVDEIADALDGKNIVVTSTGMITREYYHCPRKGNNNFYMVGSMGCASAIGLGLAMRLKGKRKVVVIDGDAAVLMKMGNMATIGKISPRNFVHIVLDNQCHETTGGQASASSGIGLETIARDCGYTRTCKAVCPKDINKAVKAALGEDGPSFILVKIKRTGKEEHKAGRPKESPESIKQDFMEKIRNVT
jgi:phosphonopyruvate decarboxylase